VLTREKIVKLSIFAVLAIAALAGGSFRAEACNPSLAKTYGKQVAPSVVPAAMLAKNNPRATTQPSIVGLWHDIHTASDGSLFLEGYDTWNSDGTESELGNLPPAGGALCVGAWKTYGKTIELKTHVAWLYDLNNNYVGTLNITERNKVSDDGNSYTGTFAAHFYNTTGDEFQKVTGTTTAERLVQ